MGEEDDKLKEAIAFYQDDINALCVLRGTKFCDGDCYKNGDTCKHIPNQQLVLYHHRVAELEKKIKNGNFIELPCRVGDTVYMVSAVNDLIAPWEVDSITINEREKIYRCGHKGTNDYCAFGDTELAEGTRWFVSKESAEKYLSEHKESK